MSSSTKYDIPEHKHKFLCELPKCEHHVHVEGTLSPELLFELAERNQITLPASFPASPALCHERYDNFADLQDFLDHYYIGMSVLIHEKDFEDLAFAYFLKAANDGLHHTETFFDPQGHVERGIAIETVVNGLNRACVRAKTELGISTKLIMCILRHLPLESAMATVQSAKPFYDANLIHGLGMDSSEKPFPAPIFTDCYKYVRENHPDALLTAHAGEETDPQFIVDTLDHLKVSRIDHGVQSYRDDALLKRLADNKIMLSVCPLSNVKLQVVEDVREVPIRKFLDHGVPFSINSDDPAYFGGYILDNYLAVESRFNLTGEEWVLIAKNGVAGSWIEEDRKREINEAIDAVYGKYKHLI
jgi:adenosine deaminase